MAERKGAVMIEGADVMVVVKYRPWDSEKPTRQCFTFRDDQVLDPSLYAISRIDNGSLRRALRRIGRYDRNYADSTQSDLLKGVSRRIQSVIEAGQLWPEDF